MINSRARVKAKTRDPCRSRNFSQQHPLQYLPQLKPPIALETLSALTWPTIEQLRPGPSRNRATAPFANHELTPIPLIRNQLTVQRAFVGCARVAHRSAILVGAVQKNDSEACGGGAWDCAPPRTPCVVSRSNYSARRSA